MKEVPMQDDDENEPTSGAKTAGQVTGRLTRKQVAQRLGVSISKVRTMEGSELHPTREDGVNYFAPGEVEALARDAPAKPKIELAHGQLAARVFRLLDAGKNLREIVTELEESPDRIRALYREWSVPDFAEGERQRQRREREEAQRRELEEYERSAERSAREWERQMRAALGGIEPHKR
jgi:hypothetical protein